MTAQSLRQIGVIAWPTGQGAAVVALAGGHAVIRRDGTRWRVLYRGQRMSFVESLFRVFLSRERAPRVKRTKAVELANV